MNSGGIKQIYDSVNLTGKQRISVESVKSYKEASKSGRNTTIGTRNLPTALNSIDNPIEEVNSSALNSFLVPQAMRTISGVCSPNASMPMSNDMQDFQDAPINEG